MRRAVETRLTTLRVRLLRMRPPLILLLGLSPSHETKALALRHLLISTPVSEMIVSTVSRRRPCAFVRSIPQIRASSGPQSISGSLRLRDCGLLGRGVELASGSGLVLA